MRLVQPGSGLVHSGARTVSLSDDEVVLRRPTTIHRQRLLTTRTRKHRRNTVVEMAAFRLLYASTLSAFSRRWRYCSLRIVE